MTESAARAEPRISYLVARLDRAIRNASAERLARYNVTVPMYTALTVLRARSGLSNAQLARRIFVSPQSMQQVVGALEADGLIKRESDSPGTDHNGVQQKGSPARLCPAPWASHVLLRMSGRATPAPRSCRQYQVN